MTERNLERSERDSAHEADSELGMEPALRGTILRRSVGYSEVAIDAFATWMVEARRQWRRDMEQYNAQVAQTTGQSAEEQATGDPDQQVRAA